jgi:hypothetical protein
VKRQAVGVPVVGAPLVQLDPELHEGDHDGDEAGSLRYASDAGHRGFPVRREVTLRLLDE